MSWLSVLSKSECMWAEVIKEKERTSYLNPLSSSGNLCVVFNVVHWLWLFFFSSHHLIHLPPTLNLQKLLWTVGGQPQSWLGPRSQRVGWVGLFVFSLFYVPFFFNFNDICSICLLIEPSLPWTAHLLLFYIFVFAVYVCFSWIVKSKWETHNLTLRGKATRFSVFRQCETLDKLHRICAYCILNKWADTQIHKIPTVCKNY